MTPRRRSEVFIAIAVWLVAWTMASAYLPRFRGAGGTAAFYQEEFAPAVMVACGRPFVNLDVSAVPPLAAFLAGRTTRFTCDSLPETARTFPPNPFQRASRYLMLLAAGAWRVGGVSWTAIDGLLATLFATTMAAAYLALRFACGRPASLVFTVLWATSPMHLANLQNYRDYAKAPFFALTLLSAAAVATEAGAMRLAVLGAAFGAVEGLGFGMRTDVVLNFVPFLVVLFAGRPEGWLRNLRAKLACAAISVAVFVVAAYPVLKLYTEGNNLWHVTLLGLTTPFDEALRIRPAPYDFGYLYDDSYMTSVVSGDWTRAHAGVAPLATYGVSYDQACAEYYARLAHTFPGDLATRMVASALRVFDLPFSITYGNVPTGITNSILVWLAERRLWLMLAFRGTGPLAAAVLFGLVAVRRLRASCVLLALVLAGAAYPFLQFQGRHVFHLEFLTLAIFALLISFGWRTIQHARAGEGRWSMADAGKAVAFVLAFGALIVSVVLAGRAIQVPRVRALLSAYWNAPTDGISPKPIALDGGRVRLETPLFEPFDPASGRVQTMMLVAEFVPRPCARQLIDVTFRYEVDDPRFTPDFSRAMAVRVAQGSTVATRVFFPAYSLQRDRTTLLRFIGLDLAASDAGCVRLARIRAPDRLPLLLNATLTPSWEAGRLYQQAYLAALLPERVWLKVAQWWPKLAALG